MLQLIGAAGILSLAVYLSIVLSVMEARRVRQIEGLLLLVRHIRGEIACFRTPVGDIYATFHNEALAECGFLAVLRESGFSAALATGRETLYLAEEELATLTAFAEGVGRSYSAEQVALCDYTERELEKALAKRREEAPKRTRVLRTLSLVGGLMLVVLLF